MDFSVKFQKYFAFDIIPTFNYLKITFNEGGYKGGYSGSKRPPSPDEIDHLSPDENDQVSPDEVDHLI